MRKYLIRLAALFALVFATTAIYIVVQFHNVPSLEPHRDLFDTPDTAPHKQHLAITFIGTSTVLVSDGVTAIMTDGFFTRPSLGKLLLGEISPDKAAIVTALRKAKVTNLAAVIPIHSHHDHAMDAPEVAKQTGAVLVGSQSTANIGRGWGLSEEQIRSVSSNKQSFQFGEFTVTLIKSGHTPLPSLIEWLVGIGEKISEPLIPPTGFRAYKEGGSFSIHIDHPLGRVLVHGSTNFVSGALSGYEADLVLLGIANLSKQSPAFQKAYFDETVLQVGAHTVVPIHWDNFFVTLDHPLRPFPRLVDRFDKSIAFVKTKAQGQGIEIRLMDKWSTYYLVPG